MTREHGLYNVDVLEFIETSFVVSFYGCSMFALKEHVFSAG
jgi:hypothetical protein